MPLSDHEQRLLDQIERALYAEDPKFASTVRTTDLRTHTRKRLRRAAVLFAVGLVLLVVGIQQLPIAIVGFLLMFTAAFLALASWKRPTAGLQVVGEGNVVRPDRRARPARAPRAGRSPRPTGGGKAQGGFMQRLEERWRKRWDERGR